MSGKIENILTNGRKKLFPELAENTEFSLMKIKSRGGKYSSALFYLFINGSLKPDYLLKVNRSPFYFEAIEKEFENLKLVYNRVFERGLQIPKPKFCIRSDENVILCESYIQGEPFLNLISGLSETEKITEYLDKGFAWLIRFQDAVRTSEERADEKWIKINVSDIIKTFLDKYPDIEVKDFLREIPVLFLEFKDKIMPLVISQGDYDQWNILSDNGKISVIDWEDTKLSTNPYDDIYTFIFHLALLSDPCKKEEENFNSFFQVNSFTYNKFKNIVTAFSGIHKLPEKMFYLFLPVFVTNAILKKYPDHRVPESWPLNSLVNLKLITEFVKRELSYAVK